MKARVIVTDENGLSLEGEVELVRVRAASGAPRKAKAGRVKESPELDFDMPIRAFIKRYARSMSGPKKFVLLLAYLAKGREGQGVKLADIERHWNKMTSKALMAGDFNRFYSNTAKENGWVDTKKPGAYFLRSSWEQILS